MDSVFQCILQKKKIAAWGNNFCLFCLRVCCNASLVMLCVRGASNEIIERATLKGHYCLSGSAWFVNLW